MAVTWGHVEVTRLLLEAGADPAAAAGPDADSNTALHLAAINGFEDIVQLLLQQPAVVQAAWEANSDGHTALALAVREGHEQVGFGLSTSHTYNSKLMGTAGGYAVRDMSRCVMVLNCIAHRLGTIFT
jgi:ankyrin repeat protein